MKTNLKKMAAIMTFAAGMFGMVSCSEKDSDIDNGTAGGGAKQEFSKSDIDDLVLEVADFHEKAIYKWRNDVYSSDNLEWDGEYFDKVRNMLISFISYDYKFKGLVADDMKACLANDTSLLTKACMFHDMPSDEKIAYLHHMKDLGVVEGDIVLEKIDSIHLHLGRLVVEKKGDIDTIADEFHKYMKKQTELITDRNTYLAVSLFGAVELSSFKAWKNLFYAPLWQMESKDGDIEYTEDEPEEGFWSRLWGKVKGVVCADGEGALTGALESVVKGETGFFKILGNAAAGAVVSSLKEGVEEIAQQKIEPAQGPIEEDKPISEQ